jgi:hypothetical protein
VKQVGADDAILHSWLDEIGGTSMIIAGNPADGRAIIWPLLVNS